MRKCVYSWTVIEEKYAIKQVDKSFYDYGETVIPVKVRKFFDIQNNSSGDEILLSVNFKECKYDSKIKFENNFNRSKLTLGKDLKDAIIDAIKESSHENNYYENSISAEFTKVKNNEYKLSLRVNVLI